jgi:hypothetical protein
LLDESGKSFEILTGSKEVEIREAGSAFMPGFPMFSFLSSRVAEIRARFIIYPFKNMFNSKCFAFKRHGAARSEFAHYCNSIIVTQLRNDRAHAKKINRLDRLFRETKPPIATAAKIG